MSYSATTIDCERVFSRYYCGLLSDTAHDYAVTSGSRVSKLLQRLQVAFSRISGSDLQQRHKLSEEDHISFQGDCLQCSVSSRWSATPNREWGGCSQTVWPQQQIDPQTIQWSLQVSKLTLTSIICIEMVLLFSPHTGSIVVSVGLEESIQWRPVSAAMVTMVMWWSPDTQQQQCNHNCS